MNCIIMCTYQKGVLSRAMDVGCAVGRSTFELARGFEEVVGIDYSRAFIHRCQELKMTGQAAYRMGTEGDLADEKMAVVHPDIVSVHHIRKYGSTFYTGIATVVLPYIV